jgi:hypothetical protein
MKFKTITILMLLCFTISTVSAQKAKKFEIGAQIGYNNTWIINQNNYGLPELDYSTYWGLGYNFQAGYNFTSDMGVFVEVGMTNQGQNYTGNMLHYDDVERTIDMKYLNVPVFFKYSYGESTARFRLLVGPQFGFLQSADQTYTVDGTDIHDIPEYQDWEMSNGDKVNVGQSDITDRFNSMDVAFVLDLGADIYVMPEMLYISVGFRGFYGFMDINADDYQVKNYDGNYDPSHNAGGGFYLGFHYAIGGKVE